MPLDPDFWTRADKRFYELIFPIVLDSTLDAARTGSLMVGTDIGWDVVHEAARQWAHQYTYQLVRGINRTTADYVQKSVSAWIDSGARLDVLRTTLEPMFGRERANLIAITEVTRAYARGNEIAWGETGVVEEFDVMTAEDVVVCLVCDDKAASGPYPLGSSEGEMPFHPGCRCWKRPRVRIPE